MPNLVKDGSGARTGLLHELQAQFLPIISPNQLNLVRHEIEDLYLIFLETPRSTKSEVCSPRYHLHNKDRSENYKT